MADNKIAELAQIDSELELCAKQFLIDEDFDLEFAGFEISIDEVDNEKISEIEADDDIGDTSDAIWFSFRSTTITHQQLVKLRTLAKTLGIEWYDNAD